MFRLLRASPLPAAAAMLQTLEIILKNAVEKGGGPEGEKYTSLRASNAALRSKVLEVSGGVLTLLLAGFQKVTEAGNVMYKVRNPSWPEVSLGPSIGFLTRNYPCGACSCLYACHTSTILQLNHEFVCVTL